MKQRATLTRLESHRVMIIRISICSVPHIFFFFFHLPLSHICDRNHIKRERARERRNEHAYMLPRCLDYMWWLFISRSRFILKSSKAAHSAQMNNCYVFYLSLTRSLALYAIASISFESHTHTRSWNSQSHIGAVWRGEADWVWVFWRRHLTLCTWLDWIYLTWLNLLDLIHFVWLTWLDIRNLVWFFDLTSHTWLSSSLLDLT
jgi:hypothetical protein